MKLSNFIASLTIGAAVIMMAGCSTTRTLKEGQFRLKKNEVSIDPAYGLKPSDLSTTELSMYVQQQPNSYFLFGWNPFLNIYNWSDGSGKGINRFWEKIGVAPVVFKSELVQSSVDNMTRHLEYLGWYGSTVSAEVKTNKKLATVYYKVTPGKRYQIDSIEYSIPYGDDFAKEFYADTACHSVKPGTFLSEKSLEAESERGTSVFRNKGFYNFNKSHYFFTADTIGTGGKAHLDYEIRGYSRNELNRVNVPIDRYRIGEVSISHAEDIKVREKVLTNLNLIHPGDIYNESVVNTTYNRLSNLKLFNGISIVMEPRDSSLVDCSIKLSDSKLQGIKMDLEASTNSSGLLGIMPKLSWYHKNIFHGGEWLSVGFSGNFQYRPSDKVKSTEMTASANLKIPRFLGLSNRLFRGQFIPRTDIGISYTYQNRPEFTRHLSTLKYGYNWQTSPKLYFQVYPVSVSYVKIAEMSDDFYKSIILNPYLWDTFSDHLDMGISGIVFHTTTPDLVPKTNYHFERFGVDLSGNLVSLFNKFLKEDDSGTKNLFGVPYSQYAKCELIAGRAWRWGARDGQSLAMRFAGGIGFAYGNSVTLPFEKQFYCGGASSMRGWQARALGPGCADYYANVFSIPSQVGDIKLEFDLEYRFKMFWKLEGAVFAEAGNVWNRVDDTGIETISLNSIAADWGLGLRVNLDFILLRLDAGLQLRDPSKTDQSWIQPRQWFKEGCAAIHFGVGYPF